MPRKNQRRKNASSQSGRRKPKPIKFNPSEIESEQNLVNETNPDDAVADADNNNENEHEIVSNNGNASMNETATDDDDDDAENKTCTLSSTKEIANGCENDHANQMDRIDDVQNDDANRTIPAAYTNSLVNRTFKYNFHLEKFFTSSCYFWFFFLVPFPIPSYH